MFHNGLASDGVVSRHWAANLLIESAVGAPDDEVLTASCYGFVMTARAGEAPGLLLSSVYRDRVVRVGGAWRFAERVSVRDGSAT